MILSNDCSLLESITPILSWDGQNSSLFLHSSDVLVTSYLTFLFLIILNSLLNMGLVSYCDSIKGFYSHQKSVSHILIAFEVELNITQ